MATQQILYLSAADVASVGLDPRTMIGLVETAFREKGHGRVEMPPKPGIHTRPDAFIHAMPAYIPAMRAAGVKWVSGYPENRAAGLPYISGLIVLNDVDTGLPYAVMDCTWITAWRTAAASALSARYLARPESGTVGILACGVQGRTHLEALALEFPVKRALAYDIAPDVRGHFVEEMGRKIGIEIEGVDDPRAAVADSDIVVTSGPILRQPVPTIQQGWLKPGAFASAVDFDSYWSPAALAEFDRLTTDDHAQFQYYRRDRVLPAHPRSRRRSRRTRSGNPAGSRRRRAADHRHQPRACARRHGRGPGGLSPGGRARPWHVAAAVASRS
jgi:ornithine cyclodeaminase/alanine dehydrogenase-like protein (mu-crystallin family)